MIRYTDIISAVFDIFNSVIWYLYPSYINLSIFDHLFLRISYPQVGIRVLFQPLLSIFLSYLIPTNVAWPCLKMPFQQALWFFHQLFSYPPIFQVPDPHISYFRVLYTIIYSINMHYFHFSWLKLSIFGVVWSPKLGRCSLMLRPSGCMTTGRASWSIRCCGVGHGEWTGTSMSMTC